MYKKLLLIALIVFSIIGLVVANMPPVKASDINKKICWGIKRNVNHEQPDLGKENKELIDKYNRNSHGKQ